MDLSHALRKAYYEALSGVVTGIAGVYDYQAPAGTATPYVILGAITARGDNTKDSFGYRATVEVVVHTEYLGDFGGRARAEQIAAQIETLVTPLPGRAGVSQAGLTIATATLAGSYDGDEQLPQGRHYTKRLQFRHLVYRT